MKIPNMTEWLEFSDGRWCAFEIKLGANQIDMAAKNLLAIKAKIEFENGIAPSILGVICGLANACYRRQDGVFVIPFTSLKN